MWLLALIASACSRAASTAAGPTVAIATLRDAGGREVGSVTISAVTAGGVRFRINTNGLTPGAHGVHVHAVGSCDGTPAFSLAGAHYNPTNKQHGRLNPNGWHAGDLPNLIVAANGAGSLDAVAQTLTVETGANALFDADGSTVMIHANQDDERTDSGPAGPGNSGARIACGVVRRA